MVTRQQIGILLYMYNQLVLLSMYYKHILSLIVPSTSPQAMSCEWSIMAVPTIWTITQGPSRLMNRGEALNMAAPPPPTWRHGERCWRGGRFEDIPLHVYMYVYTVCTCLYSRPSLIRIPWDQGSFRLVKNSVY